MRGERGSHVLTTLFEEPLCIWGWNEWSILHDTGYRAQQGAFFLFIFFLSVGW